MLSRINILKIAYIHIFIINYAEFMLKLSAV